jgi:hypothetical protein
VPVKYWQIIADNLNKAGWSWGLRLSAGSRRGEQSGLPTHIAATERVLLLQADEKLTAFLELERAVCIHLITEQV